MNEYYHKLKFVKEKVTEYLTQIFKVYGNELLLRLEDYNLLQNQNNCIETSTATGFIMEEFITSKLAVYSQEHNNTDEIKIKKLEGQATVNSSYDCFAEYNDILFMINVKVEKRGSKNNGVAAINMLYDNYVMQNPERQKAYLVLKTGYHFGFSETDKERKIMINNVYAYYLEEMDLTNFKKDNRNWSDKFNPHSGRLSVSERFYKDNLLNEEDISYLKTTSFIEKMWNHK